jgi:2-keto-4-pentenoate hydratase/2-oxohepta-3-ene-1,7-dioic acid hydratase in catechol pathway
VKLVTFRSGDSQKIGVATNSGACIFDLTSASRGDKRFESMLALIDAGKAGLDEAQRLFSGRGTDPEFLLPAQSVTLLAPLPKPRQMRDFSTFATHLKQAKAGMERIEARKNGDEAAAKAVVPPADIPALYKAQPIYYLTNRFSVSGPDTVVRWPGYSALMDFELEFGIVLGKTGRNIPIDRAREHIFGYTIYNDFSARDTQHTEMKGLMGPAKGKSFDGGNVLGPWLVTADEIADPHRLAMSVRVNGETWASGTSADMLFTFEELIAFVSRDETIHAGEFFGSGTMGNGCGLELDRYLKHGDLIELEVEGLGILRNWVHGPDVYEVQASAQASEVA